MSQDSYVETNYHHKHHSRYDAYAAYVQQRWNEGCHNIQQLWREIKAASDIRIRTVRYEDNLEQGRKKRKRVSRLLLHWTKVSAKTAVWLFIRPITDLDEKERAELETLREASETVETIYQFVQEFLQMVRKRGGRQLENWLTKVHACHIPELRRFARGKKPRQSSSPSRTHPLV